MNIKAQLALKGIFIVFSTFFLSACSLKPLAWKPPVKPAFKEQLTLNNRLSNIKKIDLKGWYGPEDFVMDKEGNLYCGVHKGSNDFSDGKILKITPKGEIEIFYHAGSWVAGLHFDRSGNLIALSHKQGLISISPDKKVTVLAKQDEKGRKLRFPNGLDIASDGTIYFSITSHHASTTGTK